MLAAWHKIDLTNDEVASGAHLRIMEEFHREFFLLLNMAVGGNLPGFNVDNAGEY